MSVLPPGQNKPDDGKADILIFPSSPWTGASFALCDLYLILCSQVAVCNLASIAVNMYVKADKTFDFDKLKQVTKVVTKNLNKIIDINFYPVDEVSAIKT